MIISLTHNRLLKTQIFENTKAISPVKRIFWPIFSPSIAKDNSQRTFSKGPEVILTLIVQVIVSIGTKRSLETNNSKKGYLPDDK